MEKKIQKPLDIDELTDEELNKEIEKGYRDMLEGRVRKAEDVFADIKKDYNLDKMQKQIDKENINDAPKSIDADQMSDEELLNAIKEGIDDVKNGRTMDLDSAYEFIVGKKK